MSSYNSFAGIYDQLTENVEYEVRSDYISGFFSRYGVNSGSKLLDLACGTGTLTKLMSEKGYLVTGVDLSPEMLTIAKEKCPSNSFLCASMTEYCQNNEYDGCYCSLDSVNHLENIDEVKNCFGSVANSLKQGGIFVFDVNTLFKHNEILAGNTFVFDQEDYYLVWDNEKADDKTIRILIDVFYFNGNNYDRVSEEFFERAYNVSELKEALSDFDILGIYDDMTQNQPKENSERIYFVCKRK